MNAALILLTSSVFFAIAFGYGFSTDPYGPHPNFPPVMGGSVPAPGHQSATNLWTWTDLGGNLHWHPVAIAAGDGTIDVYNRDHNDNHFWYRRTTTTGSWYGWALPAGGRTLKGGAAAARVDDRSVIVIGPRNDVLVSEWVKGWLGYTSLNMKSAEYPAVAGADDGSFYYFAVGFDGFPYVAVRKERKWVSEFRRMDGIQTKGGVAAVGFTSARGYHVMVFCVKLGEWYTGYLFYAEFINGQWNGDWVNTNQFTNDLPAFSTIENGFSMVVSDGVGSSLVRFYDQSNGWSAWTNLGGRANYRAAIASTGVNTAVFIVGPDRHMYVSQTFDGSSWSAWKNISETVTAQPSAVVSKDIANVFTLSEKNTLIQYAMPLYPISWFHVYPHGQKHLWCHIINVFAISLMCHQLEKSFVWVHSCADRQLALEIRLYQL